MSDGKELGEVVAAVEQAVADVVPSLKDGFQVKDLIDIGANVVKHIDVYMDAVKGSSEVSAELKEMKKSDLIRLAAAALNQFADQLDQPAEA